VIVPHSSIKERILEALVREGYVASFEVIQENHFKKNLLVQLKYFGGKSVIREMRRVSKPSLSVYKGLQNIGRVGNGLGSFILTTSKGVMSDVEARSQHVGGKILLTVR
jgi:small subunit ribosomal protein S8